MTTERIAELREKYKSVQLGSWPAVEKFVSGAYQDIKELLAEVERAKAERDAGRIESTESVSELELAVCSLIMCQELMLFDPMTGETQALELENKDNQDLYMACTLAITALQEKLEREKGCEYCNDNSPLPEHGMAHEIYIRGNALFWFDENLGWEGTVISCCSYCGKQLKGCGEHE